MSHQDTSDGRDIDSRRIALAVREACAHAAADAHERAGLGGLCEEGRVDMVLDAIRTLDVDAVLTALSEQDG